MKKLGAVKIKTLVCGFLLMFSVALPTWAVTTPDGTTISEVSRDDSLVVKPKHGMPYCVQGCDIAEDCQGNKKHVPLREDEKWTCDNKPGFCKGICQKELKKIDVTKNEAI